MLYLLNEILQIFFIQHKCSDYINKLYNKNCSEKYIAIFFKCPKKVIFTIVHPDFWTALKEDMLKYH